MPKAGRGGRTWPARQRCLQRPAGSTQHRLTSQLMGGHSRFLHRRYPCCHTVLHWNLLLAWIPKLKYHNPLKCHSSEQTTSFASSLSVDPVRRSPEDENPFPDPFRCKGLTIHKITSKGFQTTGYFTDSGVQIYCTAPPEINLRSGVFWACSHSALQNRDYILTHSQLQKSKTGLGWEGLYYMERIQAAQSSRWSWLSPFSASLGTALGRCRSCAEWKMQQSTSISWPFMLLI